MCFTSWSITNLYRSVSHSLAWSWCSSVHWSRCYNCGEPDHHAKECQLPPQPKKCHFCQSFAHMVASCPLRAQPALAGPQGAGAPQSGAPAQEEPPGQEPDTEGYDWGPGRGLVRGLVRGKTRLKHAHTYARARTHTHSHHTTHTGTHRNAACGADYLRLYLLSSVINSLLLSSWAF